MTFIVYDLCSLENMTQSVSLTLTIQHLHFSILRKNESGGKRSGCLSPLPYLTKHFSLTLGPLFQVLTDIVKGI